MAIQSSSSMHAIVIGGSMAGLLTARVLSKHFDHVTILERDPVTDQPETRKGQPHTRHLHGLLALGLETMLGYFPTLMEDLAAGGARMVDMAQGMRWYTFGGYRQQFQSGLLGALMSRPLLEWQIRQYVVALPNVTLLDACAVSRLLTNPDATAITGVAITRRNQANQSESLLADLVVDASGRGSASLNWLAELGYATPQESVVKVNIGYATRIYRRKPGDLEGAELLMIAPNAPHSNRMGLLFPMEGDRWICSLGGGAGDHPPTEEAGFLAFAQSLAAPDLYQILTRLEPLSEIVAYKYPSSLRRHYEGLHRFPTGYLVLGDAICSFNPIYGQGMTVAALEAVALDELLSKHPINPELWRAFFKAAARVVDIPWQLAVGEDFRFPTTAGKKPVGTDLVNAYVTKVHQATHHDPVVYAAFLKVMNLMAAPSSLFHPKLFWRVMRGQLRLRPQVTPPLQGSDIAYLRS